MDVFDSILLVVKLVIGIIVFFTLILYVFRPLITAISDQSRHPDLPRSMRHHKLEDEELEIPTTSQPDEIGNDKIIKMALENPTKTTMLVRNWLQERK